MLGVQSARQALALHGLPPADVMNSEEVSNRPSDHGLLRSLIGDLVPRTSGLFRAINLSHLRPIASLATARDRHFFAVLSDRSTCNAKSLLFELVY